MGGNPGSGVCARWDGLTIQRHLDQCLRNASTRHSPADSEDHADGYDDPSECESVDNVGRREQFVVAATGERISVLVEYSSALPDNV